MSAGAGGGGREYNIMGYNKLEFDLYSVWEVKTEETLRARDSNTDPPIANFGNLVLKVDLIVIFMIC